MRKRTKNETPPRELPQPTQSISDDIILSNYSTSIINFLTQLKLQQPELDFVNPFQEIIGDISKHLHRHPSRIPLAAISASWQRLSNEVLFQVQQVNQKASDSMVQQKIASLRSAIAQIRTASPTYQAHKKEHQTLYQQIKKSILLIQQSVETHDETRVSQQLTKFKTDLSHSFSKFFQLADMDKAESAQILKQCKRDANQIQRLVAGTNPLIVVPKEFYSFTKYVNSLKFEKKKPEPPRRSKTPPARFPNLICSVPKPGFSQNKNPPTNPKIKSSPSSTAISSVANNPSPTVSTQAKEKYANQTRKAITRSKTPPSRPTLMKTIANAQKPRTSKFSAVENYVFPKQYNSPKPGLSSSSVLPPQSTTDKDKKPISSIKPIGKRPVSPPNSKVNSNAKLNLNLNLNSISNINSNTSDASRPNSARDKVLKSSNSAKNSSRMNKKDHSKPPLSSTSRPVSPGAKQNQPNKVRQQPSLKYQQTQSPQQQTQNQSKLKQQKQSPKNLKNQPNLRNQQNQNQAKKIKQQNEQSKLPVSYKRNPINRYIDDNDIENDNYNDNSNDDYNENDNEIENDNVNNVKQEVTPEMKRTDSLQSLDSATDQLVLVMNKTKEQLRVSSPTLEKLQRDLSFEGLFLDGDEPAEVKICRLYKSFSKKLNLFDQLIIANDKINELNQKVEQNTWKDDKELEDYLSLIDENSIIVQFLSREKEIIYDTAKSMRQLNEKIDYYLNRNNYYSSLSNSNNEKDDDAKNQNDITNDDLTDLYATIDDQLAQINKQSPNEKERNENKKLIKKFEASKNVFYEFAEKVNAQNRIEVMKLENESLKRRITILKSIQSPTDDNDSVDNDNDNSKNEEFDISLLNENELNEMSLEEVLSIYDYLNSNQNKIKSNFVEDPRITKNRDKLRPTEEQLKTLASIHQQMIDLQKALVSIQNDEQKVSVNDQMFTRNEIESNIMKLITQEKNILQSIK